MNLRWFHALLILLSALLAVLFGIWCLDQYGREDGTGTLVAAIASFAVSLGLVVYDFVVPAQDEGAAMRITRILMMAAAVVIGGSSNVFACPMCFGAQETSLIDGAKLGVLVLLGITLAVQGGFLGFFLYLRRRAKHIAEVQLDTEWSELQRS